MTTRELVRPRRAVLRSAVVLAAVLCLSLVLASARATVGPGVPYFEIDGDYGSAIGDFNPDNGNHPYSAVEIRDGGYDTWGTRDTAACTNWSHYLTGPYMGTAGYTVRCANVPAGEYRRSEQMLLAGWLPGADSTRYFTYAFRLRGLPASLPDGSHGWVTQLHQGASDPPPFRMQWLAEDGRYLLNPGVRYDTKTAQGRRDVIYAEDDFERPPIVPNRWYRVLVAVTLGAPAGVAGCPYCADDSGSVSVWLMDNSRGEWTEQGTYNGRVGYWYQGPDGSLDPPYRGADGYAYQWKVGQYENTHDHATDYDNVAYGRRWNNITENRLIGYHKSVLRLPFDDSSAGDRSYLWNGGQAGDPVADYDNDGTVTGTAQYVTGGASGRALRLNGTNYASVPVDETDFDVGNYVTVSTWFRTTDNPTTNKGLVLVDEWSDTWKVLLYGSGQNLSFAVRHPGGTYTRLDHAFPSGTYADGQWHHVVGTFNRFAADGQRIKLYVDGEQVLQQAGYDLPILRGDNRVTVGKYSETGLFVGDLDEVNVLNYAMTADQVAELWAQRGQP